MRLFEEVLAWVSRVIPLRGLFEDERTRLIIKGVLRSFPSTILLPHGAKIILLDRVRALSSSLLRYDWFATVFTGRRWICSVMDNNRSGPAPTVTTPDMVFEAKA